MWPQYGVPLRFLNLLEHRARSAILCAPRSRHVLSPQDFGWTHVSANRREPPRRRPGASAGDRNAGTLRGFAGAENWNGCCVPGRGSSTMRWCSGRSPTIARSRSRRDAPRWCSSGCGRRRVAARRQSVSMVCPGAGGVSHRCGFRFDPAGCSDDMPSTRLKNRSRGSSGAPRPDLATSMARIVSSGL